MDEAGVADVYPLRWSILLIITLVQMALNILQFQIAGLAGRLIPALHLQPSQFAMILTAPMLTAALFGIPAGALADRFGVKSAVAIGLIIATISSFGRISAGSFGVLFAWMFALGFGTAAINANAAKILGAWFPRQQMGTAMGAYVAGATAGIAIAQATSALFPTIGSAFMTSAVIMVIALMLWLLFVKSKPAGIPDLPRHPVKEYLGVAAKNKYIWFGAVAMLFYMGSMVAQTGNLPNAFAQAKGIGPVLAGLTASSLSLAFIVGTVIGPLLAQKLGLLRPLLTPTAVLAAIASYLAWIVPFGALTWMLLILTGFLLGTVVPLVMSLPMLLPELGPVYAGSAGGIISMFQMGGAFVVPSYVIVLLAGSNVNQVFLCVSVGYLLFGVFLLFIPELGAKASHRAL
jgi:NNP family nitrate/nitrite transporter-like MFS transporter